MNKVVGYVRVSSEDQAQKDLSIPAQVKAIERYAAEQPDVQLLQIFRDEGISAYAPADKRHGFMAMIKFAKENSISHILVHKLDRFSRNREESILFKSLLKKQNVTVKSLTESYDPDTPSGFLFEGIIEVINQFYSMNLAMETRKGMAENASRGFCNGGVAPYGYDKMDVPGIGDRVHKKLTLGDPVAVANGMSARDISTRTKVHAVHFTSIRIIWRMRCCVPSSTKSPSPVGWMNWRS